MYWASYDSPGFDREPPKTSIIVVIVTVIAQVSRQKLTRQATFSVACKSNMPTVVVRCQQTWVVVSARKRIDD